LLGLLEFDDRRPVVSLFLVQVSELIFQVTAVGIADCQRFGVIDLLPCGRPVPYLNERLRSGGVAVTRKLRIAILSRLADAFIDEPQGLGELAAIDPDHGEDSIIYRKAPRVVLDAMQLAGSHEFVYGIVVAVVIPREQAEELKCVCSRGRCDQLACDPRGGSGLALHVQRFR
jgi:hypothetical protein